jgi:acylphosphatase
MSLPILIVERKRVIVRGQVQGVGFRLWVRSVATSLNLVGSCRNLPDGSCEAIVQGNRQLVKQFVIACKRGPVEAVVESIEQQVLPVDSKLGFFSVER